MARKYDGEGESIGEPKAPHGFRTMTTVQTIGDKKVPVSYETFGVGADAPDLFVKWVATLAAATPADRTKEYERWVYGVDLGARQAGKQGGPGEPWVVGGKDEQMNLVDGTVRVKGKTEIIPGKVWTLDRRVKYITRAIEDANDKGEKIPRNVQTGYDGLVAAGDVKVGPNGMPVIAAKTGTVRGGSR